MKKIAFVFTLTIVAAIQVYAQGTYIEFKMTSEKGGITGTIKSYAQGGNSRSDISIVFPTTPEGFHRVTMVLKEDPKKAYILNEKQKSYKEMDLSNSLLKDQDPDAYEVTVIGQEKVNGYNTTHVKVKSKTPAAEQDMWISTEVANYKQYLGIKSKYTSEGLFKALNAKGINGFPVRVLANEQGGVMMQIDLAKSELRNNPASLFSLAGYKKEETVPAGTPPADMDDMAKKIQNMTPEQRQQMIEQIRQRQAAQQQQPH